MDYISSVTTKLTDEELKCCAVSARLMAETAEELGLSDEERANFTVLGYIHKAVAFHEEVGAVIADYKYRQEIDAVHKRKELNEIKAPEGAYNLAISLMCLVESHVDEFGTVMSTSERVEDVSVRFGDGSEEMSKLAAVLNVSIESRVRVAFSKVVNRRIKNQTI